MKKILYIGLMICSNLLYSIPNQEKTRVKELVDYIIENQQKIFDKKEEIYTDSICVKDFNFTTFKYSQKIKFENSKGIKLYFLDKEIRKISFTQNNKDINLKVIDYKNFKLFVSNFIGFDVIVTDIADKKSFYFNFEYNTLKYYADDKDLRIEITDLKKILLLDDKLNPLSTLYIEDFELSSSSQFLFYKNKIYEEIAIAKKNATCNKFYKIQTMDFIVLYDILKKPLNGYCEIFNKYQIEIIQGYPGSIFWHKYYWQKHVDIPGTSITKWINPIK